jgi:hypothetical protein
MNDRSVADLKSDTVSHLKRETVSHLTADLDKLGERAKGTAGAGRPPLGGNRTLPPKPNERAKGTQGTLKGKNASGGHVLLPPEKSEPTLASLGVTKRESAAYLTLDQMNHHQQTNAPQVEPGGKAWALDSTRPAPSPGASGSSVYRGETGDHAPIGFLETALVKRISISK